VRIAFTFDDERGDRGGEKDSSPFISKSIPTPKGAKWNGKNQVREISEVREMLFFFRQFL